MDEYLKALDALDPLDFPEAAREVVKRLTDSELLDHRLYCSDEEPKRRQRVADYADAEAELVVELQEAHPELKPEATTDAKPATTLQELLAQLTPWEQPKTRAGAYAPPALVAHNGGAHRARRPTTKEPGTPFSGWEDVTADFLRPEPIADGNDPEVGADAPGLITEPEPEPAPEKATPAPQAQPWKAGEWYSAGELALDNGTAYVSQRLHRATDTNRPSSGAKEWRPLPA